MLEYNKPIMKKRLVKIIVFACICLLVSYACSFALVSSSYLRVVLHEVKDPDNGYDMVFVGQSRGESNINPYVLDDVMDYNSYNLCRRIVREYDIPYLLREANSNSQIKVCVLDVDQSYFYDMTPNYYSDAFIYPHLQNLADKMEYFFRYVINADYRVLLMRYTIEGMDDLKMSLPRIKDKLSPQYKEYSMETVTDKDVDHVYVGRGYRKGIEYSDDPYPGSRWNREKIDERAIDSIEELTDYCKTNGISLIAVHAPVPHERFSMEEHEDQKEYFSALFERFGIEYIDYNYISSEYLNWDSTDFSDPEGHMMSDLADEYSYILGLTLQKIINGDSIEEYFTDYPNMVE